MNRVKIRLSALFVFIILSASSCVPSPIEPPQGVWINDDFGIVLYILPEYRNIPVQTGNFSYLGVYVVDDIEIGVFVSFGNRQEFELIDIAYLRDDGIVDGSGLLLWGLWQLVDDQYIILPMTVW